MVTVLTALVSFIAANPAISSFLSTIIVNEIVKLLPIKSNSIVELFGSLLTTAGSSIVKIVTPKAPPIAQPLAPLMGDLTTAIGTAIVNAETAKKAAAAPAAGAPAQPLAPIARP